MRKSWFPDDCGDKKKPVAWKELNDSQQQWKIMFLFNSKTLRQIKNEPAKKPWIMKINQYERVI